MNLIFKKVTIDNFMSVSHAELDLSGRGTVLVKGENNFDNHMKSNGSGKSAITSESIIWALTGETNKESRNINNNKVKNGIADVKLEFNLDNDQFIVERINSGSKILKIVKNGKDISGNTYTKSKEILSNELGFINKSIITSIIVLGQGMKNRFSELSPSERKTCLEYMVGVDSLLVDIQNSLEDAGEKINSSLTELNIKTAEQNTLITSNKDLIKKYSEITPIDKAEYKKKTDEYNNLVDKYNKLKEVIEKSKAETEKIYKEKDNLSSEIVKLNTSASIMQRELDKHSQEIETLQSNIEQLKNQKSLADKAECPTCHQHLQDDKLEQRLSEELKKSEEKLSKLVNSKENADKIKELSKIQGIITTNQSVLTSLQEKVNKLAAEEQSKRKEINDIMSQIQEYDNYFDECDKQKNEAKGIEQIIKDAEKKISDADKEVKKLEKDTKKYALDKEISKYFKNSVSRKFRNFLLDGVFAYLNKKLEYYSAKLMDNVLIQIKSDGNNIDISLSDGRYYEDLSGGEQRRVDLAVQFALRDLAFNQRGLTSNMLCVDEVFDYLDETGIDDIVKFIDEETSDIDTMFVTTHMAVALNYDAILNIVKDKNGITTIKK